MSHGDNETVYNAASCPVRQERPSSKRIPSVEKVLGLGLQIRRFLPGRQLRMIGAWTFLDHIGPADVSAGDGVRVGPHPHTGLQTFTWMIEGELLHRDSLGTVQVIRPGQVNLMTAGKGISHSEESPIERSARFHATQLWIALPDNKRFIPPAFEHHPVLPRTSISNAELVVIAGEAFGLVAPATVYSPLMAAEIRITASGSVSLPLNTEFEHGFLLLDGAMDIDGESLLPSDLLYVDRGKTAFSIEADAGSRLLLIGGEPMDEDVLMWWNFIGLSKKEITHFVESWNAGSDFGEVKGFRGERLLAPEPPWPNQEG